MLASHDLDLNILITDFQVKTSHMLIINKAMHDIVQNVQVNINSYVD